jgi:signal transduction histidine kinase
MLNSLRRSLLAQLLGLYLAFVGLALGAGVLVSALVQRQLWADAQANNLALARSIGHEIGDRMLSARTAMTRLVTSDGDLLGDIAARAGNNPAATAQLQALLRDYKNASRDVDLIYWLDERGTMRVSVPEYPLTIGADFSNQAVFRDARSAKGLYTVNGLDRTTLDAVIAIAHPLRDANGVFRGAVVMTVPRAVLGAPLEAISEDHRQRGEALSIHVVEAEGDLVATSVLGEVTIERYPGALAALACRECSVLGEGRPGEDWLFSAAPIKEENWLVIAQKPAQIALAPVTSLNTWLLVAAGVFALGGLLFWLVLVNRVIRPMHALAIQHGSLPAPAALQRTSPLARRDDELGDLARSLNRLERDVAKRISELDTLLSTARSVVGTLEPRTVCVQILRAARELVDVQAASVLVPGEDRHLRVLVSEGHNAAYPRMVSVSLDDPESPSARALRCGQPVQVVAIEGGDPFPPVSFAEGFRAILAIPIISQHAGAVVLLVHRNTPKAFDESEVNLLLAFANHATLAWEHAVLYERSDERLREIAAENKRLYRQAVEDKQTLLSAVGHELRTPLAAVKGYASTLLQTDVTWPAEDQRQFVQTISDEADRMDDLVKHLLDLSRQEAGLLEVRRAPHDLSVLVARTLSRMHLADETVVVEISREASMVEVDGERIGVVLRNLIENAHEYGEGKIVIRASPKGVDALVEVIDNGPGIAPDELPNLLERFYRARRGVERRSGGTGLGLAICRAFVEAHGGRIWIDSDSAGTRVSFTLPRIQTTTIKSMTPARVDALHEPQAVP